MGFFIWGFMIRVAAYIDGYNVYHALCRFGQNHLKWVDLWKLCDVFVPNKSAELTAVHYFSAYADWLGPQMKRHQAYVAALETTGVSIHMANFKKKDRKCPDCGHRYVGHEEKETDVKLALALLDHARTDEFDRAFIVSRDSDLVPAAQLMKSAFPDKELTIVAPPHLGHSTEMISICDHKAKIQRKHVEQCLLPEKIACADGSEIIRPTNYDPPI